MHNTDLCITDGLLPTDFEKERNRDGRYAGFLSKYSRSSIDPFLTLLVNMQTGSGEYDKFTPTTAGTFDCVGCGTPLYEAKTKFASGCGWPAFYEALPGAVTQIDDSSWGMTRYVVHTATPNAISYR